MPTNLTQVSRIAVLCLLASATAHAGGQSSIVPAALVALNLQERTAVCVTRLEGMGQFLLLTDEDSPVELRKTLESLNAAAAVWQLQASTSKQNDAVKKILVASSPEEGMEQAAWCAQQADLHFKGLAAKTREAVLRQGREATEKQLREASTDG